MSAENSLLNFAGFKDLALIISTFGPDLRAYTIKAQNLF
jgi:hypothetical protein